MSDVFRGSADVMLDGDLFDFLEHTADAAFTVADGGCLTPDQGRGIAGAVRTLDAIRVSDLTRLLASVGRAGTGPDAAVPGSQEESGHARRT